MPMISWRDGSSEYYRRRRVVGTTLPIRVTQLSWAKLCQQICFSAVTGKKFEPLNNLGRYKNFRDWFRKRRKRFKLAYILWSALIFRQVWFSSNFYLGPTKFGRIKHLTLLLYPPGCMLNNLDQQILIFPNDKKVFQLTTNSPYRAVSFPGFFDESAPWI